MGTREVRPRILLVCEGKQTEPNYFNAFRVSSLDLRVNGIGLSTIQLVLEARRIANAEGDYDQVWCVFDKDDFPNHHFNQALSLAAQHGMRVAYSNQAFELWYCLHFHYYSTALTRQQYCDALHSLWGHRYEKNSVSMYEELLDRQATAVQNAGKLLHSYCPSNPCSDDPSTTVHLLVEELSKFAR